MYDKIQRWRQLILNSDEGLSVVFDKSKCKGGSFEQYVDVIGRGISLILSNFLNKSRKYLSEYGCKRDQILLAKLDHSQESSDCVQIFVALEQLAKILEQFA